MEYDTEEEYESEEARLGAVFTFDNTNVVSRVGVSFISEAQACANVEEQIPEGTTLEETQEATRAAWNAEVLSKVTTTDTNETMKTQLYTALYFMNLLPTNKTGENPLWNSTEPYYDDIFTFWDTVSLRQPFKRCGDLLVSDTWQPVPLYHLPSPYHPAQGLRGVHSLSD